jgi:hypothetical protein
VTIGHFDIRAQEIAEFTGVDMVLFLPVVEQSYRSQWESHAIESQGWIVEDYVRIHCIPDDMWST